FIITMNPFFIIGNTLTGYSFCSAPTTDAPDKTASIHYTEQRRFLLPIDWADIFRNELFSRHLKTVRCGSEAGASDVGAK
ncbi:hypothetical protein, partial [Rikenella microfusus]|uniref:hypothetical protein n=2 Tax=Rikenella microfusus TaxID=28139 RepID=UPI00235626B9